MAKHSENDFVIPALKALYYLGGKAPMSAIKDEIPKYIELSEEDKEPFVSRAMKKEARYRQVIGNITSHHNDLFFAYAKSYKEGPIYRFALTDEGTEYVKTLIAQETPLLEPEITHVVTAGTDIPEVAATEIDKRVMDYAESNGLAKRPAGDPKIRDAVLEICGHRCQYALFTGTDHATFVGKDGKPYVEAHHLIPIEARKDFFPKNLDRPSNIVCLCSVCHSIIHHGSADEKRKIMEVLYNHYKDQLNADGLYISFDKLMDKYY